MINKIKVVVLRGGNANYEKSMLSGSAIIQHLPESKYIVYDVIITKKGNWYHNGIAITPVNILKRADAVFNALHGRLHNEEKIQHILNHFGIPYSGSTHLASHISNSRHISKTIFKNLGIKTPYHQILKKDDYNNQTAFDIFKSIPAPFVIKPAFKDRTDEIRFVYGLNELKNSLEFFFSISDVVIIEEFIVGKKVTCGVLNNFRDRELYSLLPTEIKTLNRNGESYEEIILAQLNKQEKELVQNIASTAHKELDLSHYSLSHFVVSPRRGVYLISIESHPEVHHNSVFIQSLKHIGLEIRDFFDHIVQTIKK